LNVAALTPALSRREREEQALSRSEREEQALSRRERVG